jgi:hypothetical protein
MKVFVYLAVIVIYFAALSFLLLGALGFSFGLRVGGNTFIEEGFGLQRITCLVLLGVLVCVGFYSVWQINRRSA